MVILSPGQPNPAWPGLSDNLATHCGVKVGCQGRPGNEAMWFAVTV